MRRVAVGESHAIIRDGINVRRRNVLASVNTDIGVTEVISKEDDDVGFFRRRGTCRSRTEQHQRCQKAVFHVTDSSRWDQRRNGNQSRCRGSDQSNRFHGVVGQES